MRGRSICIGSSRPIQRIVAIRSASQAQAVELRVNPEIGSCRKANLQAAGASQKASSAKKHAKSARQRTSHTQCHIMQLRGEGNLVGSITPARPLSSFHHDAAA
jgi:hypothetical protein